MPFLYSEYAHFESIGKDKLYISLLVNELFVGNYITNTCFFYF